MAQGFACDVCLRFREIDEIRMNENLNIYTVEVEYDAKPNSIVATVCSVECLRKLEPGTLGMERWDFQNPRPGRQLPEYELIEVVSAGETSRRTGHEDEEAEGGV